MSYTLKYTGAQIDGLLDKINNVFIAAYGSTLYSAITGAIAAENEVIAVKDSQVFTYVGKDANDSYVFAQGGPDSTAPVQSFIVCASDGTWSAASTQLATVEQFYASLMEDTASGSIASFPDGAENVPVKELTAEITAQQDLHNLPFPYPDGGYKNRLPITATTQTVNGVTFTINKDAAGNVISVGVNGTATANTYFRLISYYALPAGSYILNGCPSGGSGTTFRISIYTNGGVYKTADVGSGAAFTVSEDYTAVYNDRCEIGITSGATCNNLVFYPMIRLSTEADATFAPYSNVCPIGGYTGAEISDYAKNLVSGYLPTQGYYNNSGVWEDHSGFVSSYPIKVSPNTHYVTSLFTKDGTRKNRLVANEVDAYGNIGGMVTLQTFTTSPTTEYLIVRNFSEESTYINADNFVYQLEEGSTPTEMKPVGNHYSVSWTDHGTVYKGTAQYKGDGEWEITPTHEAVDLSTIAFTYNSAPADVRWVSDSVLPAKYSASPVPSATPNAIAENYEVMSINRQNGNTSLVGLALYNRLVACRNGSTTTPPSGLLLLPLVTPTSFTVTGPDPETLLGDNNIWSNTGDISVKYRCNTALYIEKKLGGNVQTLSMNPRQQTLEVNLDGNALNKAISELNRLDGFETEHPELDELTEAPELEPYEEPEAEEPEAEEEPAEDAEAEEEPEAPEEVR